MASSKKPPLVEVLWIDHTSCTGWAAKKDIISYKPNPTCSIGRVLYRDKHRLILYSIHDEEMDIYGNREYIPAECVVKVRVIEK